MVNQHLAKVRCNAPILRATLVELRTLSQPTKGVVLLFYYVLLDEFQQQCYCSIGKFRIIDVGIHLHQFDL